MEEINLYDLIRFYIKHWATIFISIMIGAIIGVGYTYYLQEPKYESTATLIMVGADRSSLQESVTLNNYVELFKSRRVLEPVIEKLDYEEGYESLVDRTSAENVRNTDIINVSITTPDADTSKQLLEESIQVFREESINIYGDDSAEISVVDEADAPDGPTNMKPVQQIGLAVGGALLLAVFSLYFVYDYQGAKRKSAKKLNPKHNKGTSKSTKASNRKKS